jgi:hypothetical protein
LVVQIHSFISFLGGWSQTVPQVKNPHKAVLGWRGCKWCEVVLLVERTAKFSKMMLEAFFLREVNIQLSGNSSGGHSCSQHANCMCPQLQTSLALWCVIKWHT